MKILVTGATGFLGSHLTRLLVKRGNEVRILRRTDSNLDLLGETAGRVEHAVGDVTAYFSVEEAMRGVERVYHAAAVVGFGASSEMRRVNVEGTANVVNAALECGIQRLVHTSSIAALGRTLHPSRPIDETTEWVTSPANSAYAVTKHEAELEVHRGIAEGLDAVIVNPTLIFGPNGRAGQNTRRIVDAVRSRRLPGVPAGCTNVVDVSDVAKGHVEAMRHGQTGERYLLGGDNLSWRTIIDTLADAFRVAPPAFVVPPPLAVLAAWISEGWARLSGKEPLLTRDTARVAARCYRYSSEKAEQELGYTHRPFAETADRIARSL